MARIIWITEQFGPGGGGMAVSSRRLVNSLRDRGHSLNVLHLIRKRDANGNEGFVFEDLEGQWTAINAHDDLERLFFLKRRAMEDCILVGFGGGIPGYLATLWGKWLKTPSVVMFRGNDLDRLSHDPTRGWMVQFAVERADLVCAVARDMVSRIERMAGRPALFTPVGIIPGEWKIFPSDEESARQLRAKYSPDGRPIIGIFGHLKYKKGLSIVVDVFQNYGMSTYARLLAVGEIRGDEAAGIAASYPHFLSLHPFVDREGLVPYYLACDVVFIPSFYDGMPNVLLEAMVCKRVVVGSRAGGIPDVITDGQNGFLFNAGDSVGAAELVSRVLSFSPEALSQIGMEAFKTASTQFTAAHEADILESAIAGLQTGA
jgi:glycogen synthase